MTRRLLVMFTVGALVLSACGAAATPVPTAAPTAKPATAAPTKEPDGTLPKPELAAIKLGTPIGEVGQFASVLASMLGLYEKYGVKVEVIRSNAGGDTLQALLAGALDLASNVSADAPLTTQKTDNPIKTISVFKSRVFDGIFCGKDIKTAADLKGKSVAISTLGGAPHASILIALGAFNMAENDVVIQPIGGNSVRVAALKAGSIACAPISMDQSKDMLALGFNLLIDLSTSTIKYAGPSLLAPDAFIAKYPNTVLAIAAAQLEAQHIMLTDQQKTATEWAKFAQIDAAKALAAAQAATTQIDATMMWEDSWFEYPRKVLSKVVPDIASADLAKTGDHSFLQKLVDLGFYKKIGVPLK